MDASLLSTVSPAPLAPASPADVSAPAPQSAMRGADFANLLGHLMDPGGRQDLAAAGLKSVPIGPQIEVITVAEPLPDAASLLAFARGQGLDDATLKALFGTAAGESAAAAALLAESAAPSDMALSSPAVQMPSTSLVAATTARTAGPAVAEVPMVATALALEASRPVYLALHTASNLTADAQSSDGPLTGSVGGVQPRPVWSLPSQDQNEGPALSLSTGSAPMVDPAAGAGGPSWADGRAVAVLIPAAAAATPTRLVDGGAGLVVPVVSAPALGPLPAAPLAAASAGPLASATDGRITDLRWQVASPGAGPAVTQTEAVAPQTDLPDPTLVEALRLRLAPQEAITRQLAAMSGSGEQTAWALVSGQAASTALLRLDLREAGLKTAQLPNPGLGLTDAPVADSDGQAPHSLAHASPEPGRATQPTHAATPLAWSSTAAQRAEQYEQLAQRLGEALGQRLQSQLERGQWKMQMRLDPAQLGRIDLELDMSAGGLDAVFRSDNQLTRELIAQSLPRLRESLNQSGTAVANVWVQGDSSRQSGGNPTPQRTPEPSGQAAGHETGSQETLVQASDHRVRRGTSAWDVLA